MSNMKMKTYRAATLDDALNQVRTELGSDAVILHTKQLPVPAILRLFKKPQLEVVAALSPKQEENPLVSEQQRNEEPVPARDLRYDKVLVEMRELKQLIYEETKAPKLPKLLGEFDADLKQQGVHAEARHSLTSAIQKIQGNKRVTASALMTSAALAFDQLAIPEPKLSRILCFAGPTGVGKTTTLAKWATDEMINNAKKVGFITTDTFRIGAVEQLRTYASILKAPFEVVTQLDEIEVALEKLKDCDRIYIDTAGRNYQQQQFVEEVTRISGHEECTVQLVLSLSTSYADSERLLEAFEQVGIANLVVTKLDETSQAGTLLNLLHDYPYPIAYVTTGQHVPQDIKRFDSSLLRQVFLGEAN